MYAPLYRDVDKRSAEKKLRRYWAVFNNKEEENRVEYITFMDSLFYGQTWKGSRKLNMILRRRIHFPNTFLNGAAGINSRWDLLGDIQV
jgi:hypothetical protein